jgi:hypothetical protein
MKYITDGAKQQVNTKDKYLKWLSSLKNGDMAIQQQFLPAGREGCVLDMPYERWHFELGVVRGNEWITKGDSSPVDRTTGKFKYWDGDKDWGTVFPARLIPLHHDIPVKKIGDWTVGHHPVYEPVFLGCYRHFFKVSYGLNYNCRFNHNFKYYYYKDVERATLMVVFSELNGEDISTPEGWQYLYSEYIQR